MSSVAPTDFRGTRPAALPARALALLGVIVAIAEALILMTRDAPAQQRWVAGGLVVVAFVTASRRKDAATRAASVALLAGAALVNRATARFDSDASLALAAVDFAGALGAIVVAGFAMLTLSRAVGRRAALLAGMTGPMVIGCFGLAMERSPGAELGVDATTLNKGPSPHRTFGQWYPPHSRVRSFHASNPRNYYDPPVLRRYWRLNLHSPSDSAELQFDRTDASIFRVQIDRAEAAEPWAIQLNEAPLVVRGGIPYELRLRARADRAREVTVGISEWHSPWEGLGFARTVKLDTAWTTRTETLRLLRDDASARVHFDIGKDAVSVEFSDVVLTDLTTGQRVLPDPLPFSLTHHFNDVGCRGPDVLTASAATGARRILILGDSYALGLGVRDDDLFGARLGGILREAIGDAGAGLQSFKVMTCAVPGWSAREERLFYEHLRSRYSAESVVVITTWNDGRFRNDESAPTPGDGAEGVDARRIAPELLRLADLVRSDGARFGVIVFRNTPGTIWNPVLEALAPLPGAGVPVLDLWPSLRAHGPWEELIDDPAPTFLPNQIAHGIAATATATFLRSQGLVR